MPVTITTKIRRDGRVYSVTASTEEVKEAIAIFDDVTGRSTPPAGEYLAKVTNICCEPPEEGTAARFARIFFQIVDASFNAIRNWHVFDRVGGPVNDHQTDAILRLVRGTPGGCYIRDWEEITGFVFRIQTASGGLVKEYLRYAGRSTTVAGE